MTNRRARQTDEHDGTKQNDHRVRLRAPCAPRVGAVRRTAGYKSALARQTCECARVDDVSVSEKVFESV